MTDLTNRLLEGIYQSHDEETMLVYADHLELDLGRQVEGQAWRWLVREAKWPSVRQYDWKRNPRSLFETSWIWLRDVVAPRFDQLPIYLYERLCFGHGYVDTRYYRTERKAIEDFLVAFAVAHKKGWV